MNRRQLFAALAGAAIAPDELWTPSKSIFLPPRGGWPSTSAPSYLFRVRADYSHAQLTGVMDTAREPFLIAYYGTIELPSGRVIECFENPDVAFEVL